MKICSPVSSRDIVDTINFHTDAYTNTDTNRFQNESNKSPFTLKGENKSQNASKEFYKLRFHGEIKIYNLFENKKQKKNNNKMSMAQSTLTKNNSPVIGCPSHLSAE